MKKKLRSLCIISEHYPTPKLPKYPFVDQIACQFADLGINVTILNPVSITRKVLYQEEIKPYYWEKKTVTGNSVKIVCPRYFSYSTKKVGNINTAKLTQNAFTRACLTWFKKNYSSYDAVYGHFIFPSAITASEISKLYGIPSFLAYGENTTYSIDYLGVEETKKRLENIKGVISVSSENKNILLKKKLFVGKDIQVFPNGVDRTKFYPRNKIDIRKKYNLPQDKFIIAFVGGFTDIKGPDRLSLAIDSLQLENIKSIFIGNGNLKPNCKGILMQGPQPHEKIPELLSAADIFVLPTKAEGCCNAIIEAMACGLPIVSANLPFNDDILDESCAIQVDPTNITEIANAIMELYKNSKTIERLSNGALEKANSLDVKTRAENILNFINTRI